jgi:hypothetical protein
MLYDGMYLSPTIFSREESTTGQKVVNCWCFKLIEKSPIPHPDGARTTTGKARKTWKTGWRVRSKSQQFGNLIALSPPLLALKLLPMAFAGYGARLHCSKQPRTGPAQ